MWPFSSRKGEPAPRVEPSIALPQNATVVSTGDRQSDPYVIHTVRPVWHDGRRDEPKLLASCYHNGLRLAAGLRLARVAFPNISTGIYGYS